MYESKIMQWHCPNCGALTAGVKNEEGYVKVKCNKCLVVMVMKKKSRRKHELTIEAPFA